MTSVHPDPLRVSAMPECEKLCLEDPNLKGEENYCVVAIVISDLVVSLFSQFKMYQLLKLHDKEWDSNNKQGKYQQSGRPQWLRGLRRWSAAARGFESRRRHGCLSVLSAVCCQVSVTVWSLVQRSPTECGVSDCDREASTIRAWL